LVRKINGEVQLYAAPVIRGRGEIRKKKKNETEKRGIKENNAEVTLTGSEKKKNSLIKEGSARLHRLNAVRKKKNQIAFTPPHAN